MVCNKEWLWIKYRRLSLPTIPKFAFPQNIFSRIWWFPRNFDGKVAKIVDNSGSVWLTAVNRASLKAPHGLMEFGDLIIFISAAFPGMQSSGQTLSVYTTTADPIRIYYDRRPSHMKCFQLPIQKSQSSNAASAMACSRRSLFTAIGCNLGSD